MYDRVVRYNHRAHFGQRLKKAGTDVCWSLLMGPLIVIGALVLMVWNEKNALDMHRSLDEAMEKTKNLPTIDSINSTLEGEMIHAIGRAVTTDILQDEPFGVWTDHSLKLKRDAEMYQWTESSHTEKNHHHDDTDDEVTIYEYSTVWSSNVIDSNQFHETYGHENPGYMPYPSQEWIANPITFGAFTMPPIAIDKMSWYQSFPTDAIPQQSPDAVIRARANKPNPNQLYLGNPRRPQIGDERFKWENVPIQMVSICAVQTGDTFRPFQASQRKGRKKIFLMERGRHSHEELYEHAHAINTQWAVIWRLVGFASLWAGLGLLLAPFTILAESIPKLGKFLGGLVGGIAATVTFCIAIVVSATVIGVAWVAYRVQSAVFDNLLWIVPVALLVLGYYIFRSLYDQDRAYQEVHCKGEDEEQAELGSGHSYQEADINVHPIIIAEEATAIPYAEAIPLVDATRYGSVDATGLGPIPTAPPSYMDERGVDASGLGPIPTAPPSYMDEKRRAS